MMHADADRVSERNTTSSTNYYDKLQVRLAKAVRPSYTAVVAVDDTAVVEHCDDDDDLVMTNY